MFRGLGSLLLGAAIGAGIAVYVAPSVTPETREQMRRRAAALKDKVYDQYGDVIEKGRIRATELMSSGRDLVGDQLAKSQDLVNSAVETARTSLDQVKEQIPQLAGTAPKEKDTEESSDKARPQQF